MELAAGVGNGGCGTLRDGQFGERTCRRLRGVRPLIDPGYRAEGALGRLKGRQSSFIGFAVSLLLLTASFLAVPPRAFAYTNPSYAQVSAWLEAAAASRDLPPQVLKAIAWQESGWRQYGADGAPLISFDGGIGIMQLTNKPQYDQNRLRTDPEYNINAGADVLAGAWVWSQDQNHQVGLPDDDKDLLENWYYPIVKYNGWSAVQSPGYIAAVRAHMASPPSAIAAYLPAVAVTMPGSVIPGFSWGDYATAFKPGEYRWYYSNGTLRGTYPCSVHNWRGGGHSHPANIVCPADGGFSKGGAYWWSSGLGAYGTGLYTYCNGNARDSWGRWTFDLGQTGGSGRYKVEAFVPRNHATTTNAHYHVNNNAGLSGVSVNQLAVSDVWVDLGTYDLTAGSAWVELDDATGESYVNAGSPKIGFDCVRLTFVSQPAEPALSMVGGVAVSPGPYTVGGTISGSFTVKNTGNAAGRLEPRCAGRREHHAGTRGEHERELLRAAGCRR
jgi:hypothetical protein